MQESNAREIGRQVSVAVATELKKMDLSSKMPADFSDKMDKMGKELDRLRAVHAAPEVSGPISRNRSMRSRPDRCIGGSQTSAAADEARQYWAARKRIRCAPIPQGKDRNEFLCN